MVEAEEPQWPGRICALQHPGHGGRTRGEHLLTIYCFKYEPEQFECLEIVTNLLKIMIFVISSIQCLIFTYMKSFLFS